MPDIFNSAKCTVCLAQSNVHLRFLPVMNSNGDVKIAKLHTPAVLDL